MKKIILLTFILLSILGQNVNAQGKYWLFFKDKGPDATALMNHPEKFLSPKSIDRRIRNGQWINQQDLPVYQPYVAEVKNAGMEVEMSSKWMNAVSVRTDLSWEEIQELCPNVSGMRTVGRFIKTSAGTEEFPASVAGVSGTNGFNYGTSQAQIQMLNLDCLHDKGFTGRNVLIAVFDAGFYNVDSIPAFDSLWIENRIVTWYDFVDGDTTLFNENAHGMNVLSCIAANTSGSYIGTAPHVSVAMARTENVNSETHQEEDNWMAAVEWADSLGADIIQSSLGYSVFDSGQGDYTYSQLDGNTAIVTIAADMAAQRGILVTNSAGNEGGSSWYYITAPCDADSILCVGAVDPFGNRASFSSVGPSADGRVKPEVMAVGAFTALIGQDGNPSFSNGTSFSSPQMCGFSACLMQAHPQRTNMDIRLAIIQSADRYTNPDSLYGYGIPDACKADSILTVMDSLGASVDENQLVEKYFRIWPNPANDYIMVESVTSGILLESVSLMSADGKLMGPQPQVVRMGGASRINTGELAAGMYLLNLKSSDGRILTHKFIKN